MEIIKTGFLDYFCKVSALTEIYSLWRPFLKDPKDDIVLEAAVAGAFSFIVTHNLKDFKGIEKFGIKSNFPRRIHKEREVCMSSITVKLPDSRHKKVREVAKEDGISINQFIRSVVGEKLASVVTVKLFGRTCKKGDKDKYMAVLESVPDREPEEQDKLN